LIDTHTHLYVEAFDEDREEAIQNALVAGVTDFYIPAIDSTYHRQMFALEEAHPGRMHLMMGLHPTHVKENFREELELVKHQLDSRSFSAVGEIGIDLYWDQSFLGQQQDAFSLQIEWAKSKGLPIVIHCRDAFDEVFEVLEGHRGDDLFGIFHCFTGTITQAQRAIDLNLKLGIGGVVTFKNGKIDQFLHALPLTSIVMETDAPYLAPVPYRGKRNQSAYLPLIRDKIAQCYQLSADEISRITTENAKAVFENQK
jgi:TatD DNase family protein